MISSLALIVSLAACAGNDVAIDDAALVADPSGVNWLGITPDLRASGVVLSETGFADVVRGGSRMPNGMPAYRMLTDDELLALRHNIRQRAEAALAQPPKK